MDPAAFWIAVAIFALVLIKIVQWAARSVAHALVFIALLVASPYIIAAGLAFLIAMNEDRPQRTTSTTDPDAVGPPLQLGRNNGRGR
jgi:hypothetical protein